MARFAIYTNGIATASLLILMTVGFDSSAQESAPDLGPSPGLALELGPNLGRVLSAKELEELPIGVFPDGSGLPPGTGTAREGQPLYEMHCQSCHGPEGLGGSAEALAGAGQELNMEHPERTIGSYWPYATTLFDFNRRAMPLQAPGSLPDTQIYAITAYLLYLNGLLGQDEELNSESLPRVRMPNREGFRPIDAHPIQSANNAEVE